jgi:hypothetical protein
MTIPTLVPLPSNPLNLIAKADYNTLQTNVNALKSIFYGVATKSSQLVTDTVSVVSHIEWVNLIRDIDNMHIHQYGQPTGVSLPVAGDVVFSLYLFLEEVLGSLYQNPTTAYPNQLIAENHYDFNGHSISAPLVLQSTFVWADDGVSTDYFFNLGGLIVVTITSPVAATIQFGYSDYNGSAVVTDTIVENEGTIDIQILATAYNVINVTITITSTSGNDFGVIGSIFDYVSTDVSTIAPGGLLAPSPSLLNADVTSPPISRINLYGNTPATVNFALTNNNNTTPANISEPIIFVRDFWKPALGFSYHLDSTVIPPTSADNASITYQNNSTVGGLYSNKIEVNTDLNNLSISTEVFAYFGIVVTPGSITETIYKPTYHNFTVAGYGGRLTHWDVSVATPGFVFDVPNSRLFIDTSVLPNGNITDTAVFTGYDDANETATQSVPLDITLDILDIHLGHWLSPQNAYNGVIGMSYDIINGTKYLTIGFGWGANGTQELYAGGSLSTVAENCAIKQLSDPNIFNKPGTLMYLSQNGAYSTFLNTYGVWYADRNLQGYRTETYTFLVRNTGVYIYEFSMDNYGSFSIDDVLIDEQTYDRGYGSSRSGTVSLSAGIHTIRWETTNTGSRGQGAVGIRIADGLDRDIWSTLFTVRPTWAEISRIEIDGTARSYSMSPVIFANLDGFTNKSYSSSFANGTMFSIFDNGGGQLSMTLNAVIETTGNSIRDLTLTNAQFLPYYYSQYENNYPGNARYTNLDPGPYYPDGKTRYFTGFDPYGVVTTTPGPVPTYINVNGGVDYGCYTTGACGGCGP